jgi:hypothetical protein
MDCPQARSKSDKFLLLGSSSSGGRSSRQIGTRIVGGHLIVQPASPFDSAITLQGQFSVRSKCDLVSYPHFPQPKVAIGRMTDYLVVVSIYLVGVLVYLVNATIDSSRGDWTGS